MKHAALIYNPKAGPGRRPGPERLAERACRALEAAGFAVSGVHATTTAGEARELSGKIGPGVDRLVVIGGDGTLREAAEGLGAGSARTTIGLVPRGNGNVIARELGLPFQDGLRAADVAAGKNTLAIDAGRANGRLFLAMVGVGFDALVVHWVDSVRRSALGAWSYRFSPDLLFVPCGVLALLRFRPQRFDLEVDRADFIKNAGSVIVSNTRTYAKGWSVNPGARIADGKLDACAWKHAGFPFALRPLLSARRGRQVDPAFGACTQGERLVIRSARPFHFQLDGDPMGRADRLDIDILPRAFRIAVSDS